ncbi:hypothetical protein TNCV_1614751 [Trichonephila clavipes]|nr:hypothetical protein TNCV_1614751 [Trichonephila clavipes]
MVFQVSDYQKAVDSDDVQKLMDTQNQELTVDELKEIQEQILSEKLESLDSVQSGDRMMVGNLTGYNKRIWCALWRLNLS